MSYKTGAGGASQQMMEEIAEAYSLEFPDNLFKLIGYFSDENWLMRKIACEYCARLGERIFSYLYESLSDDDADENRLYWGVKTFTRFAGMPQSVEASDYLTKLLDHAAKSLSDGDHNKLIYIIKACGLMKAQDAAPGLIEFLGHASWIVRKEAAGALMQIGRSTAPLLKEAFSSGNKDIRYWTVKLLGQMLGVDAVDSFKKLLKSEKKDLRYYALTALGENDGEGIIELVVSRLGDESWLVRAQAAEILEKKGGASIAPLKKAFSTSSNSDVKYWTVKVLAKLLRDDAVEYMEEALDTEDSELKYCVIEAFSHMKFDKVAPLLLRLLDDPAWLVRKHVASIFLKFGGQAAAFLLNALAEEHNENIRYWAVQIISRGDGGSFGQLLNLLKDPGRSERVFIIQAIRESRNEQALPALFELLLDPLWTIRREAAYAIAEYGPEKAIEHLVENASLGNSDVRFWAQKIMNSFEKKAVDIMAARVKNAESQGELELLEKTYPLLELLESPKCVDIILSTLKGKKQAYKELMCKSLRDIKNERFVHNVLKVFDSEDAGVCFFIAQILRNISKNLYHLLYSALDDRNAEKRVWICKIFSEIRDGSFIAPLMVLLSDDDRNVRYEATRALARFESSDVFENLIKRFIDEDEEGRICIIENVKNLVDKKMVHLLAEALEDSSDTDAYWISKLLVEAASAHLELIEKLRDDAGKKSSVRYWLNKVSEHINGISYL
jgi:HEAT repeat protein